MRRRALRAEDSALSQEAANARAWEAGRARLEVIMRYVGLDSPERHVARVRARVARGGHDIPEAKVRERYRWSREHLVALLPRLTSLVVYDNSAEADPEAGAVPAPRVLLHTARGRIVSVAPAAAIPEWARPIVAAAILSDERRAGRSG